MAATIDTMTVSAAGYSSKSVLISFYDAADNGCTIPTDIPVSRTGNHLCYDFTGCRAGYPVKACTFNGGHTSEQRDPGGNVNWIPQESWNFFKQF